MFAARSLERYLEQFRGDPEFSSGRPVRIIEGVYAGRTGRIITYWRIEDAYQVLCDNGEDIACYGFEMEVL